MTGMTLHSRHDAAIELLSYAVRMSTDSDFKDCHSYWLIWRWVLQARDMVQGNVQCSLVKEFKCRKRFAHMLSRGVKRLQG